MKLYCTIVMLIACATAIGKQSANDAKALDGKWSVASAELGGEPFPKDVAKTMFLTVTGEKYLVTVGETRDEGTVKIDATKKPKAMDIIGGEGPNKGKTFLCIYEVQGDTLRVCYDLTGKTRPSEFATKKGSLLFLANYQRAK